MNTSRSRFESTTAKGNIVSQNLNRQNKNYGRDDFSIDDGKSNKRGRKLSTSHEKKDALISVEDLK